MLSMYASSPASNSSAPAAASSSSSSAAAASSNPLLYRSLDDMREIDGITEHLRRKVLDARARDQGYPSHAAKQEEEEKVRRQRQDARLAYLESESTVEEMIRINNFHERAQVRSSLSMKALLEGNCGDPLHLEAAFQLQASHYQRLRRQVLVDHEEQQEIWIQQEAARQCEKNKLNQPKYKQQKDAMLQEFQQKTAQSHSIRFKYGAKKASN